MENIKNNLLAFLTGTFFLASCGNEYPVKYVYNGVDSSVYKIEAYNSTGTIEIEREDLRDAEVFEEFINVGLVENLRTVFFIEEVVLENEQDFTMQLSRDGVTEVNTGTYDEATNEFVFNNASGALPQTLIYENDNDRFSFCTQLTFPLLASSSGFPDIRECYTEDLDQIISDKNDAFNFGAGDTIAVFLTKFIYNKME